MKQDFKFTYTHLDSLEELTPQDKELVDAARKACDNSYAPYSNFRVGAAAKLESGKIITGSNRESEVFPAGLCAERSLLFAHQSSTPEDKIISIAIASIPCDSECYPCGICRQTILDVQRRQGNAIKLIMTSGQSATIVESADCLLPFTFKLT